MTERRFEKPAVGETGVGSETTKKLYRAVADAMNKEGLAELTVEDTTLQAQVGPVGGVRITDQAHTHLSDFWRVVEGVRDQLGYGNKVSTRKLDRVIKKTIKDEKSGELRRKQDAKRWYPFDELDDMSW
jgi:hypothetical protein